MSFQVLYCPATIEVGRTFEIALSNTLLAHNTKINMEMISQADGSTGIHMIDYDGQDEMDGPMVTQARFSWHPLGFLEGSEDQTWTIKFRLTRSYPYDNAPVFAECSVQVLPASEVDKKDVKPIGGVHRQLTPDGPAPGA